MLASNLGLRNDELQRITAIGLVNGVLQDADRLEQVSGNADLAREVGGVGNNFLCLGFKFHNLGVLITVLHGGLDTGDLAVLVQHLIDVGVQHVGTAVDGGKTSKALGKLTQTVERVDVWGLSVAGHGVDVETDAVDSIDSHTGLVDVLIRWVQSHGVANEITGVLLEAELIVDILHGDGGDVQT